jgi:hypothetical protein
MNKHFVSLSLLCAASLVEPLDLRADFITNLTSSADTGLFEQSPDNNLGGMTITIAGTIGLGKRSRALMEFDVGAVLPTNATVTSATLLLNVPMAKGAGQTFELHRVLKSWVEGSGTGGGAGTASQGRLAVAGETTWNARMFPATLWGTPGGQANSDYLSAASATAIMDASSMTFSSAGMVADVQIWLASGATNFGWMIIIADEAILNSASHISTLEDTASPPNLTIAYTVPDSAPANPPNLFNLAAVGNQIRFSFSAQSNRTYAVEFKNAVTNGSWNVLTNIPALSADTTLHITNAISGGQRYFRVRTP